MFFDFLHQAQQFETIFIEIGACWDFDPLCKDFEKFIDPLRISPYISKTTRREVTVIDFCSLGSQD